MDEVHRDIDLPGEAKPAGGEGSLIGARFGDLIVIARVGFRRLTYRVRCGRCGRTFVKRAAKLAGATCKCTAPNPDRAA